MTSDAKVTITVQLDPLDILALEAMCTHLGRDRSAVISEALRCYFAVLPRPGEGGAR